MFKILEQVVENTKMLVNIQVTGKSVHILSST